MGEKDNMSRVSFILILLIIIIIPTLIYTVCLLLKCPPNPFCLCFPCRSSSPHPSLRRRPPPRRSTASDQKPVESGDGGGTPDLAVVVVITDIPTTGGSSNKESAAVECPVCLSAFEKGEEIWQLNLCNHIFHASCIDRWLCTHSSCPNCRADVAVSKLKPTTTTCPSPRLLTHHNLLPAPVVREDDDLWQGLPNSAGLV